MIGLFSFLANIGIGSIASRLAAAYEARQRAQTDVEKIAADERIKTLQARRDVIVAEAGNRINTLIRAMIAIGPAVYLFKVFAVDKVICPPLGLICRTDALSPELWQVVIYVLGFYFVAEGSATVARIVKR